MRYDFDQIRERRGSDSIKWKKYGDEVLPLWVADMDFISAEPILQALRRRVEERFFGYTCPPDQLRLLIRERLQRLYGWHIQDVTRPNRIRSQCRMAWPEFSTVAHDRLCLPTGETVLPKGGFEFHPP